MPRFIAPPLTNGFAELATLLELLANKEKLEAELLRFTNAQKAASAAITEANTAETKMQEGLARYQARAKEAEDQMEAARLAQLASDERVKQLDKREAELKAAKEEFEAEARQAIAEFTRRDTIVVETTQKLSAKAEELLAKEKSLGERELVISRREASFRAALDA